MKTINKINHNLIVSLVSNSIEYEKGRELYLKHIVTEGNVVNKGNVRIYTYTINGTNVKIKTDGQNAFKGYGCTNDNCFNLSGACRHVIAVLISINENNNGNSGNQVESTNFIFKNIDKIFGRVTTQVNLHYEEKVSILPVFSYRDNNIVANISITRKSTKQEYIIKNYKELIDLVEKQEFYSYGKKLSFIHNINNFDDFSKSFINILLNDFQIRNSAIENYIIFTNSSLDELYNLCGNYETKIIKFSHDNFDLKIDTQTEEESVYLYEPKFNIKTMESYLYGYVLKENTLYRVDKKLRKFLKTFLASFNSIGEDYLVFGGKNLNSFLIKILPVLIKYNLIEEMEDFYNIGYYPLEVKFYLDIYKKHISLELQFIYSNNIIVYGKDIGTDCLRNTIKENEILSTVKYLGFEEENNALSMTDDDLIYYFYKYGIHEFEKIGSVYLSSDFKKQQLVQSSTSVDVRLIDNWLDLKIENSNYTNSELLEAINSYSINKKYYRFDSGKYIDFEDTKIKETLKFINLVNSGEDDYKVHKSKSFFVENLLGVDCGFNVEKNKEFNNFIEKIKTPKDEIVIPKYLSNILREYQKQALYFIRNLIDLNLGGILADEMGLGKTLEVIAYLETVKIELPILIITPTSLIYNWKNEFKKFSKKIEPILILGTPEERKDLVNAIENNIYITTYELLKRDLEYYTQKFQLIIIDEAQYIKNSDTIVSRAVKSLNKINGLALTGTPIENSLKELWSIFDFIMPGYLGTKKEFETTFTIPIMVGNDDEAKELLQSQISVFVLRRLKVDVLTELPEKIETVVYAPLCLEQKLAYSAYHSAAREEVLGTDMSSIAMIGKLVRLRQLACHPKLFIKNYTGESGKLNTVLELIEESLENGNRVLLFSQFTTMLGIIKKALEENGISYYYLDGSVKSKDRDVLCAKFNSGKKDVFLISLKAGGTGLNLTGASVVIHFDPWWNPSVMAQASDRAHRFGQKKVVQVFNVISKDTIEEKIHDMQEMKKELIDSVLTKGNTPIDKLSKQELMRLFLEE
ncbi:MAG: DEAD/DEAH box helicase [Lachnospirales bacterium]